MFLDLSRILCIIVQIVSCCPLSRIILIVLFNFSFANISVISWHGILHIFPAIAYIQQQFSMNNFFYGKLEVKLDTVVPLEFEKHCDQARFSTSVCHRWTILNGCYTSVSCHVVVTFSFDINMLVHLSAHVHFYCHILKWQGIFNNFLLNFILDLGLDPKSYPGGK